MALQYDFSNYVMQVSIVPPGSTTPIPLWTGATDVTKSGEGAGKFSLGYVTDVVIELGLGFIPKITITMSMPFVEAMQFLNTNIIVVTESFVQVQFGYTVGNKLALSPVFSGFVLEPDVAFAGDAVTISIVAQGVGISKNRQGLAGTVPGTREDIIRGLLEEDGKTEVDTSEVTGAALKLLTKVPDPPFSAGWTSKWFNALQVARDCRCWLYVDSKIENGTRLDIVRLLPIDLRLSGKPRYTFQMFPGEGRIGPDLATFPILAFSRPSSALFLQNAVKGLIHKGIDEKTGEPYANFYDDKDSHGSEPMARVGNSKAGAPAADGQLPDGDQKTGDGVEPHHGDQPTEGTKDRAHAEVKGQQFKLGIPIELESLGVPELLPGEVVRLVGLGKR